MNVHVHVTVCASMYGCLSVSLSVCLYACMGARVFACMYACTGDDPLLRLQVVGVRSESPYTWLLQLEQAVRKKRLSAKDDGAVAFEKL